MPKVIINTQFKVHFVADILMFGDTTKEEVRQFICDEIKSNLQDLTYIDQNHKSVSLDVTKVEVESLANREAQELRDWHNSASRE